MALSCHVSILLCQTQVGILSVLYMDREWNKCNIFAKLKQKANSSVVSKYYQKMALSCHVSILLCQTQVGILSVLYMDRERNKCNIFAKRKAEVKLFLSF